MNRRRLLGLGLILGTAALAFTTLGSADRTVSLRYEAPPGPLTVTLTTPEGTRIRRTTFAEGANRQHEISIQDGNFHARLEIPGRAPVNRPFAVHGDGAILLQWTP